MVVDVVLEGGGYVVGVVVSAVGVVMAVVVMFVVAVRHGWMGFVVLIVPEQIDCEVATLLFVLGKVSTEADAYTLTRGCGPHFDDGLRPAGKYAGLAFMDTIDIAWELAHAALFMTKYGNTVIFESDGSEREPYVVLRKNRDSHLC